MVFTWCTKFRFPARHICRAFGLLLLATGGILMGIFLPTVLKNQAATQAKCSISGFQADMEQTSVSASRTCETSDCTFYVIARAETGESFYVLDWFPTLSTSYRSETGLMYEHEAFDCCPDTLEDCCAFEDESTGLFCDQFGKIKSDCWAGGWPCYFYNLEELLSEDGVSSHHLHVGDCRAAQGPFIAGVTLVSLGVLLPLLEYLRRRCRCARIDRFLAKIPTREKAWILFLKLIPEILRSDEMQEAVEENAARVIQRAWRSRRLAYKFREVAEAAINERRQKRVIKLKPVSRDLLFGPESSQQNAPKGWLYDTGDASTFRRVVRVRDIESHSVDRERIEISMIRGTTWLADHLSEGGRAASGLVHPPTLLRKPPGHLSSHYGIKKGHALVRVNGLEWPTHDGPTLIRALRRAKPPVLLELERTTGPVDSIKRAPVPRDMVLPPPFWMDTGSRGSSASPSPYSSYAASPTEGQSPVVRGNAGTLRAASLGFGDCRVQDVEDSPTLPHQIPFQPPPSNPLLPQQQQQQQHRPQQQQQQQQQRRDSRVFGPRTSSDRLPGPSLNGSQHGLTDSTT